MSKVTRLAPRGDPALSSVEEIIEAARNGKMFILVDDQDRENEGDLVLPAQMATPDAINFMARYGRGLICVLQGTRAHGRVLGPGDVAGSRAACSQRRRAAGLVQSGEGFTQGGRDAAARPGPSVLRRAMERQLSGKVVLVTGRR